MKIFYLITAIFLLIFTGCSSTYKVSDFSSRDKFYEDFNNFAKDKRVKVTLLNDSSFFINSGAAIQNDSLYSLGEDYITGNMKLVLSDTKSINYISNDYKSATILLKSGEKYQAKQIMFGQDSIGFAYTNKIITLNDITSINNIKIISYKNRWLGIFPGILFGAAIGTIVGLGIGFAQIKNSNKNNAGPPQDVSIWGAIFGSPIGVIIGWLIGNDYTYQFYP